MTNIKQRITSSFMRNWPRKFEKEDSDSTEQIVRLLIIEYNNTSDIYVKSLQGISSLIENVISNKQTYRPEIPMLLLKTILNQMSSLSKPQKNFHHIINKHQQLLRQV